MPNTSPGAKAAIWKLALLSCVWAACHDRPKLLAPDTTPPVFTVLSPIDTIYDLDGDGFLDLRVTWQDSVGAIDPTGVRVRTLTGINGLVPADTNLLDVWRIELRGKDGLLVHETIENLLHGGWNQLEIAVRDSAGNQAMDTVSFALPHGKFLKTIVSGLSTTSGRGLGVTYCSDDHRVYLTVGRRIVVADGDSLRLIEVSLNPDAADDHRQVLCIPDDPILYVADRVERFERTTRTWLPDVTGSFGSSSIMQSRSDPNRLYVGEALVGSIGVINRALNIREGSFIPFDSTQQEWVFDIAVLAGDTKLYATRYHQKGLLVVSPSTGETLKHVGVAAGAPTDSGSPYAIALSEDDRFLYITVQDGIPLGIAVLNTVTDSIVTRLPLPDYVPVDLAVSPSGNRLFVTTFDRFPSFPSKNVLVSLPDLTILEEFERPRISGTIRVDGAVAFHSTGKLAFVGHDTDIDVYLVRE